MNQDLIISPPGFNDTRATARLIAMADEAAVLEFSGQVSLAAALRVYEQNFWRDDVYFSHRNVLLARYQGQVVGMVLSFEGSDEPRFRSLTDSDEDSPRESSSDEVFIDALAVEPEFRGQGIALQLIHAAMARTTAAGLGKMGLLVDAQKTALADWYQKLGFANSGPFRWRSQQYVKMVYCFPWSSKNREEPLKESRCVAHQLEMA